jgi:predicted permease
VIFAVANATLFRALPYPESSRLVSPSLVQKGRDIERMDEATARLAEAGLPAFESFALYNAAAVTILGGDYPERVAGARVSESLFEVLRTRPVRGRAFTAEETRAGGPKVIVLSDGLWTRRFGRRENIVGERIALDDGTYEVVGIMAPGFTFPGTSEFWLPLIPRQAAGVLFYTDAIARLHASTSVEGARAALSNLRESRQDELPKGARAAEIRVITLHERLYGTFTQPLMLLLGAVGCVLLIACANVANLLLARSSTRRHELAVRAAIGADQGRLFRQLLAENLLLACVGAIGGVGLAIAGVRAFRAFGPPALARLPALAIDGDVLLFTLGLTAGTGLLFGVAPALSAARVDPGERLMLTRGSSSFPGRGRPRHALVVFEIAAAVVLMLGAVLLARSFIKFQSVDRGFVGENVLIGWITLPSSRYADNASRREFFDTLVSRMSTLPEAESVTFSSIALTGLSMTMPWQIGNTPRDERPEVGVVDGIGDRHFQTFGISLLEGRGCAGDGDGSAVVISAAMARLAFPQQSAVGRSLDLSTPSLGSRTIVGIAVDVPDFRTKRPPMPLIYACAGPERTGYGTVAIRVREGTDALAVAPALRSLVRSLDTAVPVTRIRTLEQMVRDGVTSRWFDAMVIGALAVVSLVLALGGLYAVTAYSVSQRTREIGVRMALGADRASVLTFVLRQGLMMAAGGILLGLLAAVPLVRFVSSMLFDVQPLDPAAFGLVAVLVTLVAVLATLVPARRASRVDPITALRAE